MYKVETLSKKEKKRKEKKDKSAFDTLNVCETLNPK